MTPKQKARAGHNNYEAGIAHGRAIAQPIVQTYPNGFSDEQCAAITEDIKQSLHSALKAIPKLFRDSFSTGFFLGVRSTLDTHRESLVQKIIGKN